MYKHLLTDPTFHKVMAEADRIYVALGQPPLSEYVRGKDIRSLRTPALFTVQVALFEMLRETGFQPDYLTGFSFGEYAALTCAGVVSFEDALTLIHHREVHSPPAGKLGGLLAVEASPEKISAMLRDTKFSIAGRNSPRQTLIATPTPKKVRQALKGVRTLLLEADQPYHSDLLLETREALGKKLSAYKLSTRPPEIPIVSSVRQTFLTRENYSDKKVKDMILDQLTTPFDFVQQVKQLACAYFLEIGPKRHVSRFLVDILPRANVRSTEEYFAPPPQHQKVSHPITKTISELTGHKHITKDMRLQEDLGIDSLRKADIILRHLPQGSSFNPAEVRTVQDMISLVATPPKAQEKPSAKFARYAARWRPAPFPRLWPTSKASKRVITIKKLPQTFEDHLGLIRRVRQLTLAPSTVLLVPEETREAGALAALLKSLAKEQNTQCAYVIGGTQEEAAREADGPNTDVKYVGGRRHVLQWEEVATKGTPHPKVLVAIGGATGITKGIARSFASRVHIIGKKARQLAEEDYPLAECLSYHQADVTKKEELQRALQDIRKKEGRVDLILNGAGVEYSKVLKEKSEEEIHDELGTKYFAAKNLSILEPKTRVVHFGSVVAQVGNPGQTVYAYANALLTSDVILWPPWDSVGMTAKPGVAASLQAQGVGLLSEDAAVTLFHQGVTPKTYLFANDEHTYQAALLPRAVEALLGKPSGGFTQDLSTQTSPHLLDHTIQGITYFPLAETIMRFLLHAHLTGRTCLQDVHAARPVILPTTATIRRSGAHLQLSTTQPCVTARMGKELDPPPPPRSHAARKVSAPYKKNALFHGPHYQMLQDIFQSEEGATANVALTDRSPFTRLTKYLDGLFQLLATHVHLKGERTALPVRLDHVRLANSELPCRAQLIVRATSALSGDGWVVSKGEVIAWCKNIQLAPI